MKRRLILFLLVVLFGGLLAIGLLPGLSAETRMPDSAQLADLRPDRQLVRVEPVVSGLVNPWGMVFLPSGEILVTEKSGSIRIIRNGMLLEQTIEGVPDVFVHGQGGLLDILLHPQFAENKLLYLSYSSSSGSGAGGNTAVLRAKLSNMRLTEKKVLYKAEPNTMAGQHFGSRLAFDLQGYLYFSIGDRGQRDLNPQRLDLDGGKIYRLHDDGAIPKGNPFQTGGKPAIFSYGHRNPQGLVVHPKTGVIWQHEHGPQGGDEINIIEAGKNYGWPVISYGINYSGTKFAEGTQRAGMEQPISYWVPSIAPCGMTFVFGNKYPGWDGDLLIGSLKFGYLVRADVEGDEVKSQEIVAQGIGRVRNVKQGPDGFVYVGVEGKGLFRLIPN